MKPSFRAVGRRFQRGSIAVEAAFSLLILVAFALFESLNWAVYFYQYAAAQKAVHDAGLYLMTAPRLELTTAGADGNPAALAIARKIIASEMAGISYPEPSIVCNYRQASGIPVPKQCTTAGNQDYKQPLIQISVAIDMIYINPLTGNITELRISPYAHVPYVGD